MGWEALKPAQVGRLPHPLLGWVGTDGLPMVARVEVRGLYDRCLGSSTRDGILPPGGRRAGLTPHGFTGTWWVRSNVCTPGGSRSTGPMRRMGAGHRRARQLGLTN